MMNIVFAGTPEFAVKPLEALLKSKYKIVGVYTQPDRPAGRGQHLHKSPVKQVATKNQIPVFQPDNFKNSDHLSTLKELRPDLMIVVAYGLILSKSVLQIPKLGCINIHASLLPRWRGASPIQQALLAGDTKTGITLIQMNEGLDTGDMISQAEISIHPRETAQNLHDKLSELGTLLLIETLDRLHEIKAQPQDDTFATYAPKINKSEAQIHWEEEAITLDRKIRAFNPWPVAYTLLQNERVRIWKAIPLAQTSDKAPGTLLEVSPKGILVATGKGCIQIQMLQLPGGKPLMVQELLNAKAQLFQPGIKLG